MRVLVTGWFSFRHGEATAGDVLSLRAVAEVLRAAGVPYEVAWSRGFRSDGVDLDHAGADTYTHLVFVCGPLHGEQIEALHRQFATCRRIAVGVSVVDSADPAVTGFHRIVPRDAPDVPAQVDLAALPSTDPVPVVAVVLAHRQREYGDRGRIDAVSDTVTRWLGDQDCARIPVDTRLDAHDWRHGRTPDQIASLFARMDAVVTTRLHGLVLALKHGVPALAVDPVTGGGKVTAQAQAWGWPAILQPDQLHNEALQRWWDWCLSQAGRKAAVNAHQTIMTEGLRDTLTNAITGR